MKAILGKSQTYSLQPGAKHGELRASRAGESKWMNPVAMMTPDPKYFAKSNMDLGTFKDLDRLAMTGNTAPPIEPIRMMNTEATRRWK
jgi:phosphopantothenoylcysteine synthetase/decarboxylase